MTSITVRDSSLVAQARTIAREVAASTPTMSTAQARFPHETVRRAASRRGCCRRAVPEGARRRRREHARARRACARRWPRAAARAAWCSRCTTSRSRASRATAWRRRSSATTSRELVEQAAADRVDHVGGRDVGRHALEHLRRRRATASASSSTRTRRRSRTASMRTESSSPAAATPDAPPSDQVLVLVRKGDYTLDADGDLGHAGHARHVQPGLQADVVGRRGADRCRARSPTRRRRRWCRTRTSCGRRVWLGIAADAVGARRAFVRAEARKKPGTVPPTATRLAERRAQLQAMRNNVARRWPPSSTTS